jgi:AcrR family transcriptional regulator
VIAAVVIRSAGQGGYDRVNSPAAAGPARAWSRGDAVRPVPDIGGTARALRPDAVGSRKPHQRVLIRKIATRLFQERGYHATTMGEIATEAGLNKATVYHYYPSKQRLLFDIYSSGIDAILTRFSAHDESMPAAEAVALIVRDVVSAMAEDQSRAAASRTAPSRTSTPAPPR